MSRSILRIDSIGVQAAEVYSPATFLINARRQYHIDPRGLDIALISADALDVRTVGQNAPGIIPEFVPLPHKVIANMVADPVQ